MTEHNSFLIGFFHHINSIQSLIKNIYLLTIYYKKFIHFKSIKDY
jgi:hypothetical protein